MAPPDTPRPRVDLRAPAPATWAVVTLLVAAYAGHAALASAVGFQRPWTGPRGAVLRHWLGGGEAAAVAEGEGWRLLTSGLVHVDPVHLGVNAVALYALGRVVEPLVGGLRLASVVVLGVVAGAALSLGSGIPRSDGASAAAFALLGAGWALGRRWPLPAGDRRLLVTGFGGLALVNVGLSLAVPALDAAAHTGGLLAGALAGWGMAPGRPSRAWWGALAAAAGILAWAAVDALG